MEPTKNSLHIISGFPKEISSSILHSLDFESKVRCEAVCKQWHAYLFDVENYQIEKENYFSKKIFPLIEVFPDKLLQIFGRREIVSMPIHNVQRIGKYPEVRERVINFLLRHDFLLCRGEDSSGRQYVAVSYHLWDAENKEDPKPFHNDALIYYEDSYRFKSISSRNYEMRKEHWKCSVKRIDLKQLLEEGETQGPYGTCGSPFTLGSNKKQFQNISNTAALFYEINLVWDYISTNVRQALFGQTYTSYS